MKQAFLSFALALTAAAGVVSAKNLPDPSTDVKDSTTRTAVLAGGCFWCTEAVFESLTGVEKVVSGYAGGTAATAKYDIVGAGRSNHAEAIEITFDPKKISYGTLLKVFFAVAHDPTTLDRQGPDWGKQYRSEVFYVDGEQKRVAEAYIKQLNDAGLFGKPIVTKLSALEKFYPAEAYHQDFVKHNPNHPYVVANLRPKIEKLRKELPALVKKTELTSR